MRTRLVGNLPIHPSAILLLAAVCCAGVLPATAEIAHIAFSFDGRYLAALDTDGNLYVNDAQTGQPVYTVQGNIKGDTFAWRPGGYEIAAALDAGYGWDLHLIRHGGAVERLTRHPAMDSSPQWLADGKKIVFISWRSGDADLHLFDLETGSARPLIAARHDQWDPLVQPGGNALIYRSIEQGETVLRALEIGKEPYLVGSLDPQLLYEEPEAVAWDISGQHVLYVERDFTSARLRIFDTWTRENRALLARERLDAVLASVDRGWLFAQSNLGLQFHEMQGTALLERPGQTLRPLDISLSQPAFLPGRGTPGLAAVASRRGIALAPSISAPFKFFFFEINDYLAHLERLERAGLSQQAEAVYDGLESSLRGSSDITPVRLHRVIQLRKKGRFQEALDVIAELARTRLLDAARAEVLRGEILFFEMRRFDEALRVFRKTPAAGLFIEDTLQLPTADDIPFCEPLAILETRNRDLIRQYAEAHAALRRGNPDDALKAIERIARYHAGTAIICDAVLDLLNNPYASESLSRPENPLVRIQYRDRMADILLLLESNIRDSRRDENTGPPEDARIRLYEELFQALLRASRFEEARQLARRMLQTEKIEALDIPEFLDYYLESDRTDMYVHNILGKVLLTPGLVPMLESRYRQNPATHARLALVRIKLALLEGDFAAAEERILEARRLFTDYLSGENNEQIAPVEYLLPLFAGKRFERLGNWDQAIEQYRLVLALLEHRAPEKTKLYFQIRAALDELELNRANSASLAQMHLVLRGMGDPILNPTNTPDQLRIGVRNLIEVLRATSPSTLDAFLLYQIGCALSRCDSPHAAAHYLDRALEAYPPEALRAALLWEKAALFETSENWWAELNAQNALTECTPAGAHREAIRFKTIPPMLHLGMREEARRTLETLAVTAAQPSRRQAARQQLELLDLKP